jgi:hypothetical protein
MLDNQERLRNDPQLMQLFSHYAKLGETNPEAWHTRLTQLDCELDCDELVDLVKLHGDGELIAFNWIEPNTGETPCNYRLTRAGQKAIREIDSDTSEVENQAA